ncbi:hypothetical protein CFOL_v3_01620 [Cephalotus follicularis]|uniref:Uncharacterized protein n=1 Tax=Cephalotus follicularis TaxID=3775 RepID=A0A1Q3AQP8_CEPFO|nr:hypothetical protein CFOL_v3_01620 [Cephalotus follicularis]
MVDFHSSISVCISVDQSATLMANSVNSGDLYHHPKSRQNHNNHLHRNKKVPNSPICLKIPDCEGSRSAAVDVVILIVVVVACGFLLFPYIKFITINVFEISGVFMYLIKEEFMRAPMLYGSIGLGFCCAALATWGVIVFTSRKCGKPNCKGLRKAAEFDIQLETEDCVKNSTSVVKDGVKIGLFELPRDHHRELEAELKKMAPPNGRAVLIFRGRCGCSIGRLEVPGPKKQRKIKK